MATSEPQTQAAVSSSSSSSAALGSVITNINNSNNNSNSNKDTSVATATATTATTTTTTDGSSSPAASPPDPNGAGAGDVDLVTQLQICLGQLTTQFYASVNYITTRHPLSAPIDPNAPPAPPPPPSSLPLGENAPGAPGGANGINNGGSTLQHPAAAVGGGIGVGGGISVGGAVDASAWIDPTMNPVTGLDPDNETAPPPPADPAHQPVPAPEFHAALRELAQDLVTKTRQIEALAMKLPDLSIKSGSRRTGGDGEGNDDDDVDDETARQERSIAELTRELDALGEQVYDARRRRDRAKRRIEEVVQSWGRSHRVEG